MGGFELRLWRKGMGWTQERAASELGVTLRTYVNWERRGCTKLVELATKAISLQQIWPQLRQIGVLAGHG